MIPPACYPPGSNGTAGDKYRVPRPAPSGPCPPARAANQTDTKERTRDAR